ncbi:hypothetical protein [Mucilaginibacter humi]|uniref:hypothetical protein n=1 Tax=Mucilaginibacter humi TaxID=2732510 RepID=UPI00293B9EAA|nr:hypothetical protein [Mucilaginibacter humi]
MGAGIGAGIFSSPKEAFNKMERIQTIEPTAANFEPVYREWKALLQKQLKNQ